MTLEEVQRRIKAVQTDNWVGGSFDGNRVDLDGEFTAHELRQIAELMDPEIRYGTIRLLYDWTDEEEREFPVRQHRGGSVEYQLDEIETKTPDGWTPLDPKHFEDIEWA